MNIDRNCGWRDSMYTRFPPHHIKWEYICKPLKHYGGLASLVRRAHNDDDWNNPPPNPHVIYFIPVCTCVSSQVSCICAQQKISHCVRLKTSLIWYKNASDQWWPLKTRARVPCHHHCVVQNIILLLLYWAKHCVCPAVLWQYDNYRALATVMFNLHCIFFCWANI